MLIKESDARGAKEIAVNVRKIGTNRIRVMIRWEVETMKWRNNRLGGGNYSWEKLEILLSNI